MTVQRAHGASFTVDTIADAPDALPCDGACADSEGNCSATILAPVAFEVSRRARQGAPELRLAARALALCGE